MRGSVDRFRGVRRFAVTVALVPVVTPVFLLLVALIVVGMVLAAVWAAAVVVGRGVAGRGRSSFGLTSVSTCRRTGLCLFGWPAPATDSPGERTILSL